MIQHRGNCTFNNDLCGWTQPVGDQYDLWTKVSDYEHSFYLLLGSTDNQRHRALLESLPVPDTGAQCLTFTFRTKRYWRWRGYSGTLNVILVNNGSEHLLVHIQEGNYDYEWQKVFLNLGNIQSFVDFKIRFTASVAYGDDMNIGNIQLLNGSCKFECNFEEDICGLMMTRFQRIAYQEFTGMWPDHTLSMVGGHYLYLESRYTTATLANINFFPYEFQCLTFWYRMSGYKPRISVFVDTADEANIRVWETSDEQRNDWLLATINLEVARLTMLTVRILGEYRWQYSGLGLDDIAMTSVSCSDCHFLDGFCNWDGSSGWRISSNGYAYPECNFRNGSTLISRSEIFPGNKCLSLFHFIEYNDEMYIEVMFQDGEIWKPVWVNTRENKAIKWTTTHININLKKKSIICIRVVHFQDCTDRYFLRSISLKQGQCKEADVTTTTTTTTTSSVYATSTLPKQGTVYTFIRTVGAAITTSTTSTADSTANATETSISVGVIIGIVIGSIGISGAVALVAVYVYRRRHSSSNRPKDPRKSEVTNRTQTGMSNIENENKSIRSSRERKNECSSTSESVYYNVHAEYATAEKKRMPESQTHISCSGDVSVYSLVGSFPDKNRKQVSHALDIDNIRREDIDPENNYHCDNVYETRKSFSDSTYNHTNEFHDDAYDSTIPSVTRPREETYSHTDFKSTVDNIYTKSSFTEESTQNIVIKSQNQDYDPTYNTTYDIVYDGAYSISHTPTKGTMTHCK